MGKQPKSMQVAPLQRIMGILRRGFSPQPYPMQVVMLTSTCVAESRHGRSFLPTQLICDENQRQNPDFPRMSTASVPVSIGTTNPSPNHPQDISYLRLYVTVSIFRFFQTLGKWCDHYLSPPLPNPPVFKINIPSTVSETPGKIPLLFYTPKSYRLSSPRTRTQQQERPLLSVQKHPILVNLHGGGYTIGSAADDARWSTAVTQTSFQSSLAPVVISVEYRLAPTYPFPTGIEDVVSAILWIWAHADEYDLDVNKTALSGFSAGGQFCFTALYRLYDEVERLRTANSLDGVVLGKVVSLVAFYPPTDWTKSRAERASSNPNFKVAIPPFLGNVMEQSYLRPKPLDMGSHLLSPGLASEELIQNALPDNMIIITCWGDGLLGEAEVFRERLKTLGKNVQGYIVPGISHGWDKWPSWFKGNPSRDEAYARAVGWLDDHFDTSE